MTLTKIYSQKILKELYCSSKNIYFIFVPNYHIFCIKISFRFFSEVDYVDTYKAMEKLVEAGLVRSIGVSNFNSEQIDRLLANCKVKPVTNQIEVGPSITQKKLTKFCLDRNIVITGFSPLGRPYNADIPELPKIAFLDSRVIAIGEKYGKTGAQVVLRYLVCQLNVSVFNIPDEYFLFL